ncbi:MAG TPA: peptide chain release factor 1, partial [Thermoanaerobaculia bacterium]|nr:peptide chain release factor 1 [Thermoanaerobaculia bacterium]
MFEKLNEIERKYVELEARSQSPEVVSDHVEYRKTVKAMKDIAPIVEKVRERRRIDAELTGAEEMVATLPPSDELHALALKEREGLQAKKSAVDEELRLLLLPKDPNDSKNVVLEIRAGTGGDEAALFAEELFRMYVRYAEGRRWKVDVADRSDAGGIGGIKEIQAIIEGEGAFSRLKYEGGVHRVQRVPATETQGRIHTSAATVAVLPEAEDVDVEVNEKDIRVDLFCASGPGGQGVNTTYSAVRLTHLPTNTVVQCQDERSQIKNKAKAMRVLKSRLYEVEREKREAAYAADRKKMVGSGDRSEKIRTYNFPQSRVTDHRIGFTSHRLAEIMDGRLDELIEPLVSHFQAEKLKSELA